MIYANPKTSAAVKRWLLWISILAHFISSYKAGILLLCQSLDLTCKTHWILEDYKNNDLWSDLPWVV